jgi:hypothetical protein
VGKIRSYAKVVMGLAVDDISGGAFACVLHMPENGKKKEFGI